MLTSTVAKNIGGRLLGRCPKYDEPRSARMSRSIFPYKQYLQNTMFSWSKIHRDDCACLGDVSPR